MKDNTLVTRAIIENVLDFGLMIQLDVVTDAGAALAVQANKEDVLRQFGKQELKHGYSKFPYNVEQMLTRMLIEKPLQITHVASEHCLDRFSTRIQLDGRKVPLLVDFGAPTRKDGLLHYREYGDMVRTELGLSEIDLETGDSEVKLNEMETMD